MKLIEMLKSKIHQARVNEKNIQYNGSISIDEDFMEAAGLYEYEKVLVANINNGLRHETYVIKGERGSKVIGINGAAARLGEIGDVVIIMSFGYVDQENIEKPKVIVLDENNNIIERK